MNVFIFVRSVNFSVKILVPFFCFLVPKKANLIDPLYDLVFTLKIELEKVILRRWNEICSFNDLSNK